VALLTLSEESDNSSQEGGVCTISSYRKPPNLSNRRGFLLYAEPLKNKHIKKTKNK